MFECSVFGVRCFCSFARAFPSQLISRASTRIGLYFMRRFFFAVMLFQRTRHFCDECRQEISSTPLRFICRVVVRDRAAAPPENRESFAPFSSIG